VHGLAEQREFISFTAHSSNHARTRMTNLEGIFGSRVFEDDRHYDVEQHDVARGAVRSAAVYQDQRAHPRQLREEKIPD
jgi:hypothetical protein